MGGVVDAQGAFGGVLRHQRIAAGLTQEELAERAGLSVRTIRDLELGATARPYRNSVDRLADALRLAGADRDKFDHAARRAPGDAARPAPGDAARPVPGDDSRKPAPPVPRQLPVRPRTSLAGPRS